MKRYYVEIPRWNGDTVHPRYWRVVSAEAGTEQDEVYRTEWTKNGSGEWVHTTSWYIPVADEAAGQAYIAAKRERWEKGGYND